MNRLGIALATASMSMAGAAAADPVAPVAPVATLEGTRLEVSAVGDVTRVPDIATIGAGVVTQAATAQAAMTENAERMARAVAALRKAGIADRDIQTSAINLSPQYRYGENMPPVITGYQASNQVNVRFRDVKRAGTVLDALVSVGANQISGPDFGLDQPEAALDEARRKAVATARARAELYASAAGLRVRRIVSISEGAPDMPGQPRMVMAMAPQEKAADTAIEAGEQKLAIQISVVFELQ